MSDIKIINGEITSITQGIEFNDTSNTASGTDSAAFGNQCGATGDYSFASGFQNGASATYSWVGGYSSDANGTYSFAFGNNNLAVGSQTAILGGLNNTISGTDTLNSIILAGSDNTILDSGSNTINSSIIGGSNNDLVNANYSSIVGGILNYISGSSTDSAQGVAIVGGSDNIISGNTTSNAIDYSTIVGGTGNLIKTTTTATGARNTIVGGQNNTINGVNGSAIVNGDGITLTEDNTTYIGGIKRGGYVLANTLAANQSSTSTTPADITGWSFNAVANAVYRVQIIGTYTTAALTTGGRLKIAGTATCGVGGKFYGAVTNAAAATELAQPAVSMTTEFITTGVGSTSVRHHIGADIIFQCTGAGTVKFQWGSEVAGSSASIAQASSIIVERID